MVLQNINLVKILGSKIDVVCARVGGANTTPYLSSAAHFAKQKLIISFLLLQNMKSVGEKIWAIPNPPPPPSPPPLPPSPRCPARPGPQKKNQSNTQKTKQTIFFSLAGVRIEAPRTAQKLLGQNPERKTPFPFSRKISPPPNQKCKECFFFRGCWRTRKCVGLSPSVRFSFEPPRAPRVRHHLF